MPDDNLSSDQTQTSNDELGQNIAALSDFFDEFCRERHELGAKEYGPYTFLENDVIRMMCEEMADIANYARMEFIKVLLLQEGLETALATPEMGAQAFKGTGAGWKKDDERT